MTEKFIYFDFYNSFLIIALLAVVLVCIQLMGVTKSLLIKKNDPQSFSLNKKQSQLNWIQLSQLTSLPKLLL